MSIATLISFSIALFILLTCLRRGADVFSPARVFGFVWCLVVGIADFKLSYLQHEWSLLSWILLLLGPISFLLGVAMLWLTKIGENHAPTSFIRELLRATSIDSRGLFRVTVAVFLLYAVSYVVNVLWSGFIPIFAFAPGVSRTQWGIFGFGLFIHSAPVILVLTTQYFIACKRRLSFDILFTAMFFSTIGSYVLLLQRYNLAMWLLMSILLAYYAGVRIRLKTILMLLTILAVTLTIIQSARFTQHVENYLYFTSRMKFSVKYALFTEPYMYTVMGLENFCRAVDRLDHFTYGYFSFNPLLSLGGLKHWVKDYFSFSDTPFLVSGYNTYPFHWYYYYDFGVVGMVLLSSLTGMLVYHSYWKLRMRPSYLTVSMYSSMLFVAIMSFYLNPLTMLNFLYVVFLLYVCQRYLVKTYRTLA